VFSPACEHDHDAKLVREPHVLGMTSRRGCDGLRWRMSAAASQPLVSGHRRPQGEQADVVSAGVGVTE
jgi:hypothetical protein